MLRTVSVSKRDVCPGDICKTIDYQLDDSMTIADLLRFIAREFLWAYLHYQWRIAAGNHDRPLGFIARRKPDERLILNTPGEVGSHLTRQLNRNDLVECCVSPELTIKDLDIASVFCIDED